MAAKPEFRKPEARPDFPALEHEMLKLWEDGDIFRRSLRGDIGEDGKEKEFVFNDGPPFATGLPHYGHLLAGTLKDIVPRYWTMRGYRVERRFGWGHPRAAGRDGDREVPRAQWSRGHP